MAFLKVEDLYGGIEVIIFPKVLEKYNSILTEECVALFEGRINLREDEQPKLLCEKVTRLEDVKENDMSFKGASVSLKNEAVPPKNTKTLFVKMGTYDADVLKKAKNILEKHKGDIPVCFFIADAKKRIYAPRSAYISENSDVLEDLSAIFGADNVKFG